MMVGSIAPRWTQVVIVRKILGDFVTFVVFRDLRRLVVIPVPCRLKESPSSRSNRPWPRRLRRGSWPIWRAGDQDRAAGRRRFARSYDSTVLGQSSYFVWLIDRRSR